MKKYKVVIVGHDVFRYGFVVEAANLEYLVSQIQGKIAKLNSGVTNEELRLHSIVEEV